MSSFATTRQKTPSSVQLSMRVDAAGEHAGAEHSSGGKQTASCEFELVLPSVAISPLVLPDRRRLKVYLKVLAERIAVARACQRLSSAVFCLGRQPHAARGRQLRVHPRPASNRSCQREAVDDSRTDTGVEAK